LFNGVELPPSSRPKDLAMLQLFYAQAPDATLADIPRALRFLRARGHRLDDALALWRIDQEWRRSENIGGILDEPIEAAVEDAISEIYHPLRFTGRARDGRLVMYRQLGEVDIDLLKKHKHISVHNLTRRHLREMERLRRDLDRDAGGVGPLGGHLSILDLKGTTVKKFLAARAFFQLLSSMDGTHYAEMLGVLLIINPPPLTHWAIDTLKPFMDPTTARKIVVRDGPPDTFMSEYVEPTLLPPHLRPTVQPTSEVDVPSGASSHTQQPGPRLGVGGPRPPSGRPGARV
jgi:hypothetical protein